MILSIYECTWSLFCCKFGIVKNYTLFVVTIFSLISVLCKKCHVGCLRKLCCLFFNLKSAKQKVHCLVLERNWNTTCWILATSNIDKLSLWSPSLSRVGLYLGMELNSMFRDFLYLNVHCPWQSHWVELNVCLSLYVFMPVCLCVLL